MYTGYSQCVVSRHPKAAAAVVLSTVNSDQILRAHPGLITADCLDAGQLTLPGQFVRYGLAEALVRQEFAKGLPPDTLQAAPLKHPEVSEADFQPKSGKKYSDEDLKRLKEQKERAIAWRAMSEYGECVARANLQAGFKLMMSAPSSRDETQAFAALQPALSQCLPQGQTISLTRSILRGAIAVNLYRLAKAPRIATPTATK